MSAVSVRNLRKAYAGREVVAGIDLEIPAGEVFALLGPNGAGKTTTVEILEGFRRRDSGEVSVLGVDPEHGGSTFRERIGIVLQSSAVYPRLRAREMVEVFGGYYASRREADEVLRLVGLEEQRDVRVRKLSGGQLRRLDLALALVGNPELVFLDEPTTGFDPEARRRAWETIAELRTLGTTILLTTHYLDEAQALADRVAIVRGGTIVAEGSPEQLLALGGETEIRFEREGRSETIRTSTPTRVLHELTADALARGEELAALEVRRPTLEDVYLELARDDE